MENMSIPQTLDQKKAPQRKDECLFQNLFLLRTFFLKKGRTFLSFFPFVSFSFFLKILCLKTHPCLPPKKNQLNHHHQKKKKRITHYTKDELIGENLQHRLKKFFLKSCCWLQRCLFFEKGRGSSPNSNQRRVYYPNKCIYFLLQRKARLEDGHRVTGYQMRGHWCWARE